MIGDELLIAATNKGDGEEHDTDANQDQSEMQYRAGIRDQKREKVGGTRWDPTGLRQTKSTERKEDDGNDSDPMADSHIARD
jgi:hypothetical protein